MIHSRAPVGDIDQQLGSEAARGDDHAIAGPRCLDRVLDEMGQSGFEAVWVDRHSAIPRIIAGLDDYRTARELAHNRTDGGVRVDQGRRARHGVGLELAEQIVHPRNGIFDRPEHVALKLGIVEVPFRIRHDQIKLAREILDVMDHESEALAVFGQQFGIAQYLCRALFGEITS